MIYTWGVIYSKLLHLNKMFTNIFALYDSNLLLHDRAGGHGQTRTGSPEPELPRALPAVMLGSLLLLGSLVATKHILTCRNDTSSAFSSCFMALIVSESEAISLFIPSIFSFIVSLFSLPSLLRAAVLACSSSCRNW